MKHMRREKIDPKSDFWYVIRIGAVIAMVMFIVLPFVM